MPLEICKATCIIPKLSRQKIYFSNRGKSISLTAARFSASRLLLTLRLHGIDRWNPLRRMRRLLNRNWVPEDRSKYYFEFDRNAPSMLDAKQTMDVIAFCNRDTEHATFVSIFSLFLSSFPLSLFLSFLWTLPLTWIINAYKLRDACRVSCQRITLSRLILVNKWLSRLIWFFGFDVFHAKLLKLINSFF